MLFDKIYTRRRRAGTFVSLAGAAFLSITAFSGALARDAAPTTDEGEASQPPLHMVVSLEDQQIRVYRGLDLIETSPISSGKRGHSTPTGVFSILEKRRKHFSNLYDNAPMPFMQRLTWSGVAMHVGRLPGRPASHGCIRLPRDFAKSLYSMTDRGMHVVVTRDASDPVRVSHSVLPQPFAPATEVASLSSKTIEADPALRGAIRETELNASLTVVQPENPDFDQPLRMIITPQKQPGRVQVLQDLLNRMGFNAGPVDGVLGRKTRAAISLYQEGADLPVTGGITDALEARIHADAGYEEPRNAMLRVRRKFRDIYSAPVSLKDIDLEIGTHVFTALDFQPGDASVDWIAVSAEGGRGGAPAGILDRIEISDKVATDLARMLTPGTSLTVTDRSFARNTGLGTDFVVITR
ncbi:L,D-transpeptidase family protein [Roseibium marinum]|uniref:Putative peptidoglycan binding protein n=1 Tax=Roseibium marinum TaxID=281252 RepID=A0A2S3V4S4_9HYPH|nr:L,D-transpeptidase family protein [Roseibium marinum]POF34793.1 putative peptidoglycan binding protein [Roseibium marinum]